VASISARSSELLSRDILQLHEDQPSLFSSTSDRFDLALRFLLSASNPKVLDLEVSSSSSVVDPVSL
jgi:hypothetical protein